MLSLFLNNCSTTWETNTTPKAKTYMAPQDQLSRTVGKLRSLLILPVVIQTKDCPDTPSENELSEILHENTGKYLSDWKGYKVLYDDLTEEKESSRLVERLGIWQEGDVGDGIPSEADRLTIISLANKAQVDGVLVMHGNIRCLNGIDIIGYFMFIGMPNWTKKLFGKNISACIYEANSGRLVWKQYNNFLHPGVGGGFDPSLWPSSLFSNLENAVPAVLSE